MYIYGGSDERDENGNGEDGGGWRLPGFLYGESREDMRVMVGHFVEV